MPECPECHRSEGMGHYDDCPVGLGEITNQRGEYDYSESRAQQSADECREEATPGRQSQGQAE